MTRKVLKEVARESKRVMAEEGRNLSIRLCRLNVRQTDFAYWCGRSQRLICYYAGGERRIMPIIWTKLEELEAMPKTQLNKKIHEIRTSR